MTPNFQCTECEQPDAMVSMKLRYLQNRSAPQNTHEVLHSERLKSEAKEIETVRVATVCQNSLWTSRSGADLTHTPEQRQKENINSNHHGMKSQVAKRQKNRPSPHGPHGHALTLTTLCTINKHKPLHRGRPLGTQILGEPCEFGKQVVTNVFAMNAK